jgi:ketosteroid isomerase-like protein
VTAETVTVVLPDLEVPALSDPIPPPAAFQPAEALELVSLALSDGDLEAAVAQYEPGALLRPWARDGMDPRAGLRDLLASVMALRLPLSVTLRAVLPAGDLALVIGDWQLAGLRPDRARVDWSGTGATLLRRQPDGTWCILADAWCLSGPGAL